ncbi:solute carrier family 52, riboflavin transporter, member 3-B-like isoform X1 [Centruroides vittatus]|uniref:solute carrier family 52, riboflavin transporter, member 3-B-like isoform X1 n=2 Tax=Centruroides vittatus TaxID=120091 RepID=UPI0035103451
MAGIKYGSLSISSMTEFGGRILLIDILAVFFGLSSWMEINGLWVELPVLIQVLPEGWSLASYIVVITQIANLGPIIYTLACRKWSSRKLEIPVIYFTLLIGITSCFLLTFLWSKTSVVFGKLHSTALLSLAFLLAFVDCTSSVLYLPFMAHYKEKYLLSYLIGEGMSGLLPGIVALIQGVGGNAKCKLVNNTNTTKWIQYSDPPLFSAETFFGILTFLMIMSGLSFIFLHLLPQIKEEKVMSTTIESIIFKKNCDENFNSQSSEQSTSSETQTRVSLVKSRVLNKRRFVILLAFQVFCCALTNGILPAIQTYSCLPYGNVAYHLSVTLSSISNPLACFVAMFFPTKSLSLLSLQMVIGTGWSIYIMTAAVTSPSPPLIHTTAGVILIILSWICFVSLLSYVKACSTSILRQEGSHFAMLWCGGISQIGSATGALIVMLLVTFTNTFQSYNVCKS